MDPVTVVGGGIGGMSIALALAHAGIDVRVFESRPESSTVDRGDVLQPASYPVLQRWGVTDHLDTTSSLRFHRFRILDRSGRALLDADTHQLFPQRYAFTSIRHELLLRAARTAAIDTGRVELRYSERVLHALTEHGRICGVRTAKEEIRSAVTVLSVGGSSRLCDSVFGPAQTFQYKSGFYNIRVHGVTGFDDSAAYVVGDHGTLVLVPLPGNEQRIGFQIHRSELERVKVPGFIQDEAARRFTPFEGRAFAPMDRPQTYMLRRATRNRWILPGAVVIGDAAHQVHPIGGQGMNLAIGDAAVLGECLARADRDRPAEIDTALQTFETRRRGAVGRTQRRTHWLGRLGDTPVTGPQRSLLRAATRSALLKRAIMGTMMEMR